MPNYYPVMLDLRGRIALVIGGDAVAAEKATALVASGAQVHVQSPEFCETLSRMAEQEQVTLHRKAYQTGDLAGAFIVVAATHEPQLVQAIWMEAQERGQLLNIVDEPAYCSFILPSILRREQLTIAVSTEGASPGLAKRIRQNLEDIFPPAYGPYVRLAALVRAYLRAGGVSYEQRDNFFGDFFASDVLEQLIAGNGTQALETTATLLHKYGLDVSPTRLEADFMKEERHGNRNT